MSKNRKALVDDALSNLTKALEQREKELDDREEKLNQCEKRLEAEHAQVYGKTTPSDVLHLNIGGTKTTVLRRTLTSVPGSMLAARFSGRWDDSLEKDREGNIFIDQDFCVFNIMLTYLRYKANGDDKYPLQSPDTFESKQARIEFYRMIEYYGMTNGIYPTKLKALRSTDSLEMVGPQKGVAKKWTTLELTRDGHSRMIKTYEVTLGEVQRFQMGWGKSSNFPSDGEDLGVGGYIDSFALDLSRSVFLKKSQKSFSPNNRDYTVEHTTVEGLEHPAGTVVLSKDYGRLWFINGQLVFDAEKKMIDSHQLMPLISIKGEFEITSIELDC